MAGVTLICGKICCGKSTYAAKLRQNRRAVVLSVDEVMLALFDPLLGNSHDEIAGRTQRYLLDKSVELISAGIDVILDWGFWTKRGREDTRAFYGRHGIPCEVHYIDVSDDVWLERMARRNAAVQAGETTAYYVDENLAAKCTERFEPPARDEIDVWIEA